jgi:hypothetical protein
VFLKCGFLSYYIYKVRAMVNILSLNVEERNLCCCNLFILGGLGVHFRPMCLVQAT